MITAVFISGVRNWVYYVACTAYIGSCVNYFYFELYRDVLLDVLRSSFRALIILLSVSVIIGCDMVVTIKFTPDNVAEFIRIIVGSAMWINTVCLVISVDWSHPHSTHPLTSPHSAPIQLHSTYDNVLGSVLCCVNSILYVSNYARLLYPLGVVLMSCFNFYQASTRWIDFTVIALHNGQITIREIQRSAYAELGLFALILCIAVFRDYKHNKFTLLRSRCVRDNFLKIDPYSDTKRSHDNKGHYLRFSSMDSKF